MKKFVISLCGSACTGKTTLCDDLSKRYPRVKFIKSFNRTWIKDHGYNSWVEVPTDERRRMQEETRERREREILKVLDSSSPYTGVICDRSPFDNIAYTFYTYSQSNCGDVQQWVEEYKEKCIKELKLYNHLIYIPQFSIPYCDDGLRASFRSVEDHIGYIIRGVFEERSYIENDPFKYCILTETSLLKRIEYVQNIINTFYKE